MSCKNNKFKISALTWNEEFELPDGSYAVYQSFLYANIEKRLITLQQKYMKQKIELRLI